MTNEQVMWRAGHQVIALSDRYTLLLRDHDINVHLDYCISLDQAWTRRFWVIIYVFQRLSMGKASRIKAGVEILSIWSIMWRISFNMYSFNEFFWLVFTRLLSALNSSMFILGEVSTLCGNNLKVPLLFLVRFQLGIFSAPAKVGTKIDRQRPRILTPHYRWL